MTLVYKIEGGAGDRGARREQRGADMRVMCRHCYKQWDDNKCDGRRLFSCKRCQNRGFPDEGVVDCLSGAEFEAFWKWMAKEWPSGEIKPPEEEEKPGPPRWFDLLT